MEEVIIRNKEQKERFDKLYSENVNYMSNDLKILIKNVIIIFKRHYLLIIIFFHNRWQKYSSNKKRFRKFRNIKDKL